MSDVRQLSGPEMAARMTVGTRVKPGADWESGDQDGPAPGLGTVIQELDKYGYIVVSWDNKFNRSYRMGREGMYELQLAEPSIDPKQTRG